MGRIPERNAHRQDVLWKSLAALLLLAVARPATAQVLQGSSSNVGYIDSAIPTNQFRERFEAAYDINRSDRAEFLYQRGADPRIDYQDLSTYVELLISQRFSGFVEMHEHFVNPTGAPNAAGLGDMNVGFKWAFLLDENQAATLQTRVYIPTGNPLEVLGMGHAAIEPGLLLFERLSERLTLEGEFKDWIPLSENGYAGNVLRYGLGVSYKVVDSCGFSVSPVFETVGWTVLSGKETVVSPSGIAPAVTPPGETTEGFPVKSAAGDTIVNAKFGVRVSCGSWGDIYAGYGRALTGAFWYKDMFRVEYRLSF